MKKIAARWPQKRTRRVAVREPINKDDWHYQPAKLKAFEKRVLFLDGYQVDILIESYDRTLSQIAPHTDCIAENIFDWIAVARLKIGDVLFATYVKEWAEAPVSIDTFRETFCVTRITISEAYVEIIFDDKDLFEGGWVLVEFQFEFGVTQASSADVDVRFFG